MELLALNYGVKSYPLSFDFSNFLALNFLSLIFLLTDPLTPAVSSITLALIIDFKSMSYLELLASLLFYSMKENTVLSSLYCFNDFFYLVDSYIFFRVTSKSLRLAFS